MDSFELTKIAAAVLAALLLIFGMRTFVDIALAPQHGGDHAVVGHQEAKSGHGGDKADATETAAAGETAGGGETADATAQTADTAAAPAKPAGFDGAAVAALVDAASAADGEKVFRACKACHSNDEGGANKVGPALWGVVGRDKGAVDGFKYSKTLSEMDGDWTLENLAGFIHNPKEYAAGTKMIYRGLKDDKKLADLLAYLKTLQ